MRSSYHRIFNDKEKLYQAINLRASGWSFSDLAQMFKCDRDSIRQQCLKYGIQPSEVFNLGKTIGSVLNSQDNPTKVQRIVSNILKQTQPAAIQWEELDGINYSRGKFYQEYLEDSRYPHRRI